MQFLNTFARKIRAFSGKIKAFFLDESGELDNGMVERTIFFVVVGAILKRIGENYNAELESMIVELDNITVALKNMIVELENLNKIAEVVGQVVARYGLIILWVSVTGVGLQI